MRDHEERAHPHGLLFKAGGLLFVGGAGMLGSVADVAVMGGSPKELIVTSASGIVLAVGGLACMFRDTKDLPPIGNGPDDPEREPLPISVLPTTRAISTHEDETWRAAA